MLTINIITVGKIKKPFIQEEINEFIKCISKFAKINIIIIKKEKIDSKEALQIEGIRIIKFLNKGYNIIAEIKGEMISSEEFAKIILNIKLENSIINFVIGSSHGLSDKIKAKADLKISFSKMTFPYSLFRLMLVEQIYRALSINNNGKYHK